MALNELRVFIGGLGVLKTGSWHMTISPVVVVSVDWEDAFNRVPIGYVELRSTRVQIT